MTTPVNFETAANTARAFAMLPDAEAIAAALQQLTTAIYEGRADLDLSEREACDFAFRFRSAVVDEMNRLARARRVLH